MIWVEDSWVVVDNEHEGHREFQGVVFDITERKAAAEQIAFLAYHDKLTGSAEPGAVRGDPGERDRARPAARPRASVCSSSTSTTSSS